MSITRRKPPMSQEPARPATMTFESLAERLGDGPLRTLLTLHVRAAGVLAPVAAVDDLERIETLVELAQIARLATAQLDDFTLELQRLIDDLAAANGKMQ